jgi:thioesterase domain-containing protein
LRVAELLAELRTLDAHVELDGERLRLNAPAGVLNDDTQRQVRERKAEIVAFLRTARQLAGQQRAVVPLKPSGTRIPIFAVGGHNGDVFCYVALTRELDAEQPFYGLQPPGLEEGSQPATSIEGLAAYFADQIREFKPNGPLIIAGFCAGGTVAFELARQLSESGRDVRRLILFGAPYCTSYRALPELLAFCSYYTRRAPHYTYRLAKLPPSEWERRIVGRLRARRAAARATRPDAITARRVAVEKATFAAVRRYRPRPFDGELALMLPCEATKRSLDAPLRWRRHARTSTEFVGPDDCNGDTMLLPAHAATFAAFLVRARGG